MLESRQQEGTCNALTKFLLRSIETSSKVIAGLSVPEVSVSIFTFFFFFFSGETKRRIKWSEGIIKSINYGLVFRLLYEFVVMWEG